ncbi:MAG: hypothetical protein ACXWLM_09280 [Myxococcales bacterium]
MNRILDELTGAAGLAATVLFAPLLRPRYSTWGCTPGEAERPLPGDGLAKGPVLQSTRAISIDAPPREVWRWLAQMGQGRGGLYSYQGLENLMGCHMRNTAQIHPELQRIAVGDVIRTGPEGFPSWTVAQVDFARTLVLAGPGTSWAFVLEPLDAGQGTRLLVRSRLPDQGFAWRRIVDPGSFVFERRMLLGIRERAERLQLS